MPEEAWFDGNMMQKDMLLALELGRELDVPLPTVAARNEVLTAARAMGLAKHDFAIVFKVLAKMAGSDEWTATVNLPMIVSQWSQVMLEPRAFVPEEEH